MRAPASFVIIAVILLLWNLMGVAAFVMQYGADLGELAKTDPDTARAFAQMPGWAWAVYAVAVLGVLHFFWMRAGKQLFGEVVVYAAILGALLGWRAWWRMTR